MQTATAKKPKPFVDTVRISASFGSEHQRTVAMKNLSSLLAAWKKLTEDHHKENKITISHVKGEDLNN